MSDLIKALQIFLKYKDVKYPTNCRDDVLEIMDINESDISADDIKALDDLGFYWDDDNEVFYSFKFGSA